MSQFGVVTYKEKKDNPGVDLKKSNESGFVPMVTNPEFIDNATMLQGRVLSQGINNIVIYLNGEFSNNLFSIEKGADYITFLYQGSTTFLKSSFLLEINILGDSE